VEKKMDMALMKGRSTIRKGGSLTGVTGKTSRFTERWCFDTSRNPSLKPLEAAYDAGFDAVDRVEARTRANAADGRFTPQGSKHDVLTFALSDLVPVLHKSRLAIKKIETEVAARESKFKLDGPDKSDVAAAFRRMEIRTRLREMPAAQQTAYFAGYGNNLPADVAMAVLELPPEYSGVPQSRHDILTHSVLDARHGAEIAELAEIKAAIAVAETVVELARDEVRLEVGCDTKKFNELAAPIEAKSAAPWLKKFNENGNEVVRVIIPGKSHTPQIATQEEVATGIFYSNFDEYMKDKVA
jgi:hypothetical protein